MQLTQRYGYVTIMLMIVKCLICSKDFYGKPSHIKLGKCKYCSKKCYDEWQRKNPKLGKDSPRWNSLERHCRFCDKVFFTSPARIAENRGFYCSKDCYTNGTKGVPTGKKLSDEARIKLSLKRRGVLNPSFKNGLSRGYKRYKGNFSHLIKEKVRERFRNTCQGCGERERLHVHHIDDDPLNNNEENLTLLCIVCHAKARKKL